MTKLNWEKARSRDRYLKSLFASDRFMMDGPKSPAEAFDVNNPIHNPLGLTDEDCRGRMPSPEKRAAIVKYLLERDKKLRSIYPDASVLTGPDSQISAKTFAQFSRLVFTSDWSPRGRPLEELMPYAVCFSISSLAAYNSSVSKGKRAISLTPEILSSLNISYGQN